MVVRSGLLLLVRGQLQIVFHKPIKKLCWMNSCLNTELFKNKILGLTLTPVGVFFVIPDLAHIKRSSSNMQYM